MIDRRCLRTVGLVVLLICLPSARADDEVESRDQILREIASHPLPVLKVGERSPERIREVTAEMKRLLPIRSGLIGRLYRADPSTPDLDKLLPEHWRTLVYYDAVDPTDVVKEFDEIILGETRGAALKSAAADLRPQYVLKTHPGDVAAAEDAVERYVTDLRTLKAAKPEVALGRLADACKDEPARRMIYERIRKDYPETAVAKRAVGKLRRIDGVGKEVEFEFVDAIGGAKVSSRDLRGKVVVIDFWATWCVPCVEKLAERKRLFEEYEDRGVAFVGVSWDIPERGGLDRLKEMVKERGIAWPQWYEGKTGEGTFAYEWGVDMIPTVFLIDRDGKLRSTSADLDLEAQLRGLLEPEAGR